MSERDLEARLRSAYRAEARQADPGALVERVRSIPATAEPERRRWWHGFRSGATRHAELGGAQVRGASNMLTATGITAIVAALALGTTFLAVSTEQEAGPQPGAPTTAERVVVTGIQDLYTDCSDEAGFAMCGRMRNVSDPRLKGEVRITFEHGSDAEEDPAVFWSTVTITNQEGSWRGQSVGFSDEEEAHRHSGWFEGEGAYEGLASLMQLTEAVPDNPSGGLTLDVAGLIYEGELPPMVVPDWVAEPEPETE